jgi:hypothetical protein
VWKEEYSYIAKARCVGHPETSEDNTKTGSVFHISTKCCFFAVAPVEMRLYPRFPHRSSGSESRKVLYGLGMSHVVDWLSNHIELFIGSVCVPLLVASCRRGTPQRWFAQALTVLRSRSLQFHDGCYWKPKDDTPFCQRCWEADRKLLHLSNEQWFRGGVRRVCSQCDKSLWIKLPSNE